MEANSIQNQTNSTRYLMDRKIRVNKEFRLIKIPFIGEVKVNVSGKHGIESATLDQKLGFLGNSLNFNFHSKKVRGRTALRGTGLSQDYDPNDLKKLQD